MAVAFALAFGGRLTSLPAFVWVLVGIGAFVLLIYFRLRSGDFLARHHLIRRAFLMVTIYFCFSAVRLEINAHREYQRVKQWPVTEAVITSGSVYTTSYSWTQHSDRFCPRFEYNYSVAGHDFTGSNLVFDFTCWPNAYDFVAQHAPGSSVQIAYDPKNPAITMIPGSVQDPGHPWADLIGGLLFSFILLADLFLGKSYGTSESGEIMNRV